MAKEIGRLRTLGLGAEATAGTADTIDIWLPLEDGGLKPKSDQVTDQSNIGNIVSDSDAHIVKLYCELEGKGILRPISIGWLLYGALGAVGAATLVETNVYSHAFTVANNNNHKTFTAIGDDQTQEEVSTYQMVDSLTISGEVGDYARFDLKMKGRKAVSTTSNTPSFLTTGENPFMVSRTTFKFATNIAGLGAAAIIPIQDFKVTIDKNLEQIWSTQSATTDALDFATQHNDNLEIKGDITIVYDSATYKDLYLAGTKQAMSIAIEGRALIGATKYEKIDIQLASVIFEEWDRSTDSNGITTQTIGFKGLYKLSETKAITVDLTNLKTTTYA